MSQEHDLISLLAQLERAEARGDERQMIQLSIEADKVRRLIQDEIRQQSKEQEKGEGLELRWPFSTKPM